ncbi:MAG: hypothetical protein WBL67_12950 [Nitrososphaeraceae archaeon]
MPVGNYPFYSVQYQYRHTGLREPLKQCERRPEWKAAHGFRKFYKTHAEQVMKLINVEMTMGHNIGISASYYRPAESEVLKRLFAYHRFTNG